MRSPPRRLRTSCARGGAASADGGGQSVVAHNSVMTLIAYTGDEERAQRIEQVAAPSSRRCRARHRLIPAHSAAHIAAARGLASSIQSATANGAPGSRRGDPHQGATTTPSHHLPGAVLPLIALGLPSFLWWSGEPPWHTELFEALVDGCDRLIVDTSEAANAQRALCRAQRSGAAQEDAAAASAISTGARQAPWRELVAQFFDDHAMRAYLEASIASPSNSRRRRACADNPAQAYLFAGWLASRLGWVPHDSAARQRVEVGVAHTLLRPQGRAHPPRADAALRRAHELVDRRH